MDLIRKTGLTLTAVLLCCVGARAQSIAEFRYKLSVPDTLYGSFVRVTEHGPAAGAVNAYGLSRPESVQGLRICIFLSNSQSARQDATAARESFRAKFPDVPAYLVYENPRFVVNVGNCITEEEALILQNRVKDTFPTAFVWRGEIPLAEFVREPDKLPAPVEDDDGSRAQGDDIAETPPGSSLRLFHN